MIDPRDFGRLEGKVDQILDLVEKLEPRVVKLEARVGKIENRQWYAAGGGSMLGAIAALLVKGHAA